MFTTLIYQPLLNLTVAIYNTIGLNDVGFTVILVTLTVRAVLLPLSLRAGRSQKAMSALAPDVDRIRQQHKDDLQAQSTAVNALYKERGVSPMAGCLPILLQLPILIGLYKVFSSIFKPGSLDLLYPFIERPDQILAFSFGFLDVSVPSHVLAVLAGVAQFVQLRYGPGQQSATGQAAAMNRQMSYTLPVVIVIAGWSLPAALSLYWITTTVASMGEQLYIARQKG